MREELNFWSLSRVKEVALRWQFKGIVMAAVRLDCAATDVAPSQPSLRAHVER